MGRERERMKKGTKWKKREKKPSKSGAYIAPNEF